MVPWVSEKSQVLTNNLTNKTDKDQYKSMRRSILLSLIVSFLVVSPQSVFAMRQSVLGTATTSAINMPATTEGPGLILPDSPFFFLDTIKQDVRLFFAFSPENKAKVHTQIAGERLAELRVMLAKNNQKGAVTALDGVASSLQSAVNDLEDANLQGKDTKSLAQRLNTTIAEKQETLATLEAQSSEGLQRRVSVIQQTLKDAKQGVISSLPKDQQETELKNEINQEIEDQVKEASDSAKGLERSIDVLTKLASEAASKQQESRSEALKKAIERKNELLTKQTQAKLEHEIADREKVLELTKKQAKVAKETAKTVAESAKKILEAQKEKQKIESSHTETTSNESHANSGSSRSGSEDSHSGSDDH
jgi:hypothetical protein